MTTNKTVQHDASDSDYATFHNYYCEGLLHWLSVNG